MTSLAPPPQHQQRKQTVVVPDTLATIFDIISASTLLRLVRRYKWIFIGATLAGASMSVLKAVRVSVKYTATARFVMNSAAGTAVAGVPGGGAFDAPQFFIELLKSREILWATANAPLQMSPDDSSKTTTAIKYLRLRAATPGELKNSAVATILDYVSTEVGLTGIVTLNVTTSNPDFSSALANALIDQGNQFVYTMRLRRLAGDKPFIERRLEVVQNDLRNAEARLRDFLTRNRTYQNSPELTMQFNRLSSEVTLRQTFYQQALTSHEQTKIEQIRNTPVTSVIEAPDPPARPDRKISKTGLVLGAAAGFILAAFGVLLVDLRQRVAFERAIA